MPFHTQLVLLNPELHNSLIIQITTLKQSYKELPRPANYWLWPLITCWMYGRVPEAPVCLTPLLSHSLILINAESGFTLRNLHTAAGMDTHSHAGAYTPRHTHEQSGTCTQCNTRTYAHTHTLTGAHAKKHALCYQISVLLNEFTSTVPFSKESCETVTFIDMILSKLTRSKERHILM